MPDWNEILKEISTTPNQFDLVRRKYVANLNKLTGRNTIIYYSGWLNHTDPSTAISDEDIEGFMNAIHQMNRELGLDLVLHTPGGDYHATINHIRYLREMFGEDIRTIIPQIAMSAGTIIACMGKEIVMGKHSNLGPIDPHIGGVSAANIKEEFDRINNGEWPVEVVNVLLSKYPLSFLNKVEKLLELSKNDFTCILQQGMFKNEINDKDRKVEKVVESLSKSTITKSHERHLSKEECKTIGLKIIDIEGDSELQDAVLSIHHACMLTFSGAGRILKIIENHDGKAFIKTG